MDRSCHYFSNKYKMYINIEYPNYLYIVFYFIKTAKKYLMLFIFFIFQKQNFQSRNNIFTHTPIPIGLIT